MTWQRRLHFWLGRSYARMAEVSDPFSARRNARKAQAHLQQPPGSILVVGSS